MSTTRKAKIVSMKSAFEDCENLENITIEGFDTSQVTSMKNTFFNNSNLNLISLDDNFNTDNVEDMSYMFANSRSTELNLKNFNTKNVKNMSNMFLGCDQIKRIKFRFF